MADVVWRVRGLLGLAVLLGIACALSRDRRRISLRTVVWGLGLQLGFALLILRTAAGRAVFGGVKAAFTQLIAFTDEGARFVFGSGGFCVAFRVLPIIIFFASLMGVLYHVGVMQKLVAAMAWVMRHGMRVSGAEALSAAGNVFVGMTEAPLMIRPYVARLTQSELLAVMVGGLATIAGSVLAFYVSFGISAGHLLCASVMSAPAALVMAKIMLPETEESATAGSLRVRVERTTQNVIDAAASGATEGLRLALNVGAMLIAFIALLAMVNYFLTLVHDALTQATVVGTVEPCRHFAHLRAHAQDLVAWATGWEGGLPRTLQEIFGVVFRPLAWLMGVPWSEAGSVGSLMGIKISANELIAYQELVRMKAALSPRSVTIATYALCGFANFGSIAILIGGIGGLAPERRQDLSRLAPRALAGGALASFSTAAIAGMLA